MTVWNKQEGQTARLQKKRGHKQELGQCILRRDKGKCKIHNLSTFFFRLFSFKFDRWAHYKQQPICARDKQIQG